VRERNEFRAVLIFCSYAGVGLGEQYPLRSAPQAVARTRFSKKEVNHNMAANSQQGTYIGTTLTGFTALVAGLVTTSTHSGSGWLVTFTGLALLGISTVGFVKLKALEAKK
jgi:hypothetical protein